MPPVSLNFKYEIEAYIAGGPDRLSCPHNALKKFLRFPPGSGLVLSAVLPLRGSCEIVYV